MYVNSFCLQVWINRNRPIAGMKPTCSETFGVQSNRNHAETGSTELAMTSNNLCSIPSAPVYRLSRSLPRTWTVSEDDCWPTALTPGAHEKVILCQAPDHKPTPDTKTP